MGKYIYDDKIIEYTGFKKDDKFCFYLGDGDESVLIYLSQYKVDLLKKII